jgi:hypothetical protein
MNELTRQFHINQFPGWRPTKPLEENMRAFWTCELPFLEIDCGLDLDNIYKEILQLDQSRWTDLQEQKYQDQKSELNDTSWFYSAHSQGVQEIRLKSIKFHEELIPIMDQTPKEDKHEIEIVNQDGILQIVYDELEKQNIHYDSLKVVRLGAGGWLYPHKDQYESRKELKLTQMWIPLNHCQRNLKMYPYGYMPNKVGKAYLLNNFDYIHSAFNKDNHPRDILLLKVRPESFDIKDIQSLAKQQWYA